MVKRVFWSSLLAIGLLIIFVTSYHRHPAPNVVIESAKAPSTDIHKEMPKSPSLEKAVEAPVNVLEVISNQPIEQMIASSDESPLSTGITLAGEMQELFDGTMAPRYDPAPEIKDFDDLFFYTIVSSLATAKDVEKLKFLIGVHLRIMNATSLLTTIHVCRVCIC